MPDESNLSAVAPLRTVERREYREILRCGHSVSWNRPAPGTGGHDWPKLVQRRRCLICAGQTLNPDENHA
jgi:hypothetical protein